MCKEFVTNQITPPSKLRSWRELYIAALFETDQNRIPTRIADAEKAIVARARELFNAKADTIEEDQALDDALYALRALRTCVGMRGTASSRLQLALLPRPPRPDSGAAALKFCSSNPQT